jgi:endonuclease/exonuclease/phosphatase (EEP) superfamily protein YafD
MSRLDVATFNTEWRKPQTADACLIRDRLGDADVVCLTEAYEGFFGQQGQVLAAPFVGTGNETERRKVLLWSKNPWREIDEGDGALSGFYLGATTETPLGPLRVHGVVIPYRFSGVRYGTPKRKAWERHLAFLEALDARLPEHPQRAIVLGDFNQRVPRRYQPQHIFDRLDQVILRRFVLATGGQIPEVSKQAIDHICHTHDLALAELAGLSNVDPNGRLISDHFGLRVSLAEPAKPGH